MSEKTIPTEAAREAPAKQDDQDSEDLRKKVDKIWELAHEANTAYGDHLRSRNTKLHEMRHSVLRILEICDEIRLKG